MKKKIILISSIIATTLISSSAITITSCSNQNTNLSTTLNDYYTDWYNNLTTRKWNKDSNNQYINYSAKSEQQAIGLYSWCSGSFWNENLHAHKEPVDGEYGLKNKALGFDGTPKTVFGEDYKYMVSGLDKAISPNFEFITYHGVEYAEIEIYDQLKEFIIKNDDGSYDYSRCKGQTITSYGFISTSIRQSYADNFFDWRPHYENYNHNLKSNPLGEPVLFKIKVKPNTSGVAYLSNYDFAGFGNGGTEEQVLLNINKRFKINNISKIKNSDGVLINLFDVELID